MPVGADIPRVEMGPSTWVRRFADLIPVGGNVLDLACGAGRHGRLFVGLGHYVVMLDRDLSAVADMAHYDQVELIACDLEDRQPWPLDSRQFEGVIVTNYLHRPILKDVVQAVAAGGVLIYETFAEGNQTYGRPRNPNFLLKREELLTYARPELNVLAFEDVVVSHPRLAAVQRIAAIRPG